MRPKVTYHSRLFLGLLAYSVVLLVCFAVFQYHREKEFKALELNERLQAVNKEIIDMDPAADTGVDVQQALRDSDIPGLRVSVIDSLGNVVYDNTLDRLPGSNHLDRKEIADAMEYGQGFTVRRHSSSTGQTYFYSARRGDGYVVRSAMPYDVTLDQLLSADRVFLWFMLGVTVVMCVVGYYSTRSIVSHRELQEREEKDRIKHQLTNNINHELKTPVASIKGCLDTLNAYPDMDARKRQEFVRRGLAAVERLSNLLADVSLITRLDDGSASITREEVDVREVVAEVCDQHRPQAAQRGMHIANDITEPFMVNGNRSLLLSVFNNLVDNALKYSGGDNVRLWHEGNVFFVADNGVGVPQEHLDRIFERFYRIDKGRSRSLGGTGLGLAIVRNAILWHGGVISVQNLHSGGLQFRFTI